MCERSGKHQLLRKCPQIAKLRYLKCNSIDYFHPLMLLPTRHAQPMKKNILLILFFFVASQIYAQSPTCNLQAIQTAMAAQGYQQLNVAGQPCFLYFYNSNATNNWATAQQQAQAVGGNLVSINDATENAAIQAAAQAAGLTGSVWLGFTDQATEGTWLWADGSTSTYTNWAPGEPSNNGGLPCNADEDAAVFHLATGLWNDSALNNTCPGAAPLASIIKINLCPNIAALGASACSGQTVTLNATTTGGSAPYTIAWFSPPSQTPIAMGASYTPTVTGNAIYVAGVQDVYQCTDTAQVLVSLSNCTPTPQGCDITGIRNALTGAGYIELNVPSQPCSMYFIYPQQGSSSAAQAAAQQFGANTVSFQTAQENADVLAALYNTAYTPANYSIWIGLSDAAQEGTFVWLDGAPVAYTNWAPNEPNNQTPNCCTVPIFGCQSDPICSTGEDCVQMYGGGTWNDLDCASTNAISVIEVSLCPQITATNDTLVCENSSLILSASTILGSTPYTYAWTPGNLTGNSVTVTPSAPTTYTVRSTDRWGCYQDETINVATQQCSGPVSTCDILAIRNAFTAAGYTELQGVVGQDCSMYFINNSSQSSITAQQAAQQLGANLVVFNDAAENTAVVAALNANGIISSVDAVWIGYTDVAQEGTYLTLDGTPLIFSNWASGEPNNNGQGASCCSVPSWLGGCSGTLQCSQGEDCVQIYTSGQWNDLPCDRQSKSVIEVNLCPVITTSPDATICTGQSTTLTASTLLGSTPYNYTWTSGGATSSSTSVAPTSTTLYTVSVTDRWNCQDTASVTVTINGGTAQTFTIAPTPICDGTPGTVTYTGSSPAGATYTWNFDGATVVSGSGQGPYTLTWSSVGTKNITLDVVDNGCTSPQTTQSVNIGNTPVADAGADVTICSGGTIQIGGTATNPNHIYQWFPSTNLSSDVILNPNFSLTNTTSTPIVLQYVLGVLENGCADTDTMTVTVNPPAPTTISASSPLSFCDGGSVDLIADSVFASYVWSNQTLSNTLNVTQSGSFFMAGVAADGCQFVSNTLIVTVHQNPTLSLVNATNESCFGFGDGDITITANGGTPTYNYAWGTTPPQNAVTATTLSAGSYPVTATDANQCTVSATYSITSPAEVAINLDSLTNASCFEFTDGQITISSTGGVAPVSFSWSNGVTTRFNNTLSAGNYSITVSDANNCTSSASYVVTEPAEIIIPLLGFDSIPFNTETQINLNVQPSSGTYTYAWAPPNYLSCTNCGNPTFSAIQTINYFVTVTDAFNCTATANISMNVLADKQVFFPNAFTPNNNDFVNDVFGVFTNGLKYYSLEVYNRIGEKVFLSYNETRGWDGTYKGEPSPPGVYTYVAVLTFLDGENRKYKGTVTLLR